MGLVVVLRLANVQLLAQLVERLAKQFADRLFHQARAGLAHVLRLSHRAEDRHLGRLVLADLQRPGIAQEQVRQRRLLAVGKGQHALLAQGIAAKAGQHVQQIMRIAHPVEVPGNLIGKEEFRRAITVQLVHQPLG